MRSIKAVRFVLAVILAFTATLWTACDNANTGGSTSAPANSGKVPVTTKSEEARKEFLQGRDLSEKLLAQDSLQHFDKALALDPEFATAELARANNSPTAKEFFDHLNKAVSLADKASDGEKFVILMNQAGANGESPNKKTFSTNWSRPIPMTNELNSLSATIILASRNTAPPSSTTGKPRSWRQATHPPTTFLAMPTANRATMPTPNKPSRNTSN